MAEGLDRQSHAQPTQQGHWCDSGGQCDRPGARGAGDSASACARLLCRVSKGRSLAFKNMFSGRHQLMQRAYITTLFATTLVVASPAWAVFKCTLANGRVTFQDLPCDNSAKSSEAVKTYGGNVLQSSAPAAKPGVQPNTAIKGPPQAGAMLALYRRWADGERLAFSTARIALATPIASQQALKREAEALAVPECLNRAKDALNALIERSNEAVLRFAAKEEVASMVYTAVERPKLIPQFEREVERADCAAAQ